MTQRAESQSIFIYRPKPIRRSKWVHHYQVWSPKLARRLSLYSRRAIDFWAMLEAHPEITTFCEYPGRIRVDECSRLADFAIRKLDGDEFIVLDGAALSPLGDEEPFLLDPKPVRKIEDAALDAHRTWIANWLQMIPYLTSNGRFLTPGVLTRLSERLSAPKPLVTIERHMLPLDPMITRTAAFELLRRGIVKSDDLINRPLGPRTVFERAMTPPPDQHA